MTALPETYSRPDWPRLVKQTIDGIIRRVLRLETATVYSVETVTFTPTTEPGSPIEGTTYMDSGTHKLRVYDGMGWQDCW